jgi:hypothetical protein
MRKFALVSAIFLTMLFEQPGVRSQISSQNRSGGGGTGFTIEFDGHGNGAERAAGWRNIQSLNTARKKEITKDGLKLLRLATDLKAQLDRGDGDANPAASIRKVEEIAKLAHGIRAKMVQTYDY